MNFKVSAFQRPPKPNHFPPSAGLESLAGEAHSFPNSLAEDQGKPKGPCLPPHTHTYFLGHSQGKPTIPQSSVLVG